MATLTQKQLKDYTRAEYARCSTDIIYFLKKYCKIQHPMKGTIPFQLFPFQETALRDFVAFKLNVVLKARQMGISTLVAGYSLWLMTFHSDKNILVIATKLETAKNLVTKVRMMYQNLPSWLRPTAVEQNKTQIKFSNGSQIKSVSSSPDAARSEGISLLVLDEAAFIRDINEIWTSATPTLATGGSCIILSTPAGVGNLFHRLWVESLIGNERLDDRSDPDIELYKTVGKNMFHPIKLHWKLHPERGQDWRDEQDRVSGPSEASQECDCSFLSSGNSVIDLIRLEEIRQKDVYEPDSSNIRPGIWTNDLWIWKPVDFHRQYMVVADVARGDGTDFSTFHVMDIETCEQVAEYKSQPDTHTFAHLLAAIGTEYNNALIVVENNNVGWATLQELINIQYANLFYQTEDPRIVDPKKIKHNNRFNADEKREIVGFCTSSRTRPLIIDKLEQYFRDNSVTIHSSRLHAELQVFIWHGGKAQARNGYNDDLVMPLAIFLWVRETALKMRTERLTMQRSSLMNIRATNAQSYNNSGMYTPIGHMGMNPYQVQMGGGIVEDVSWLLDGQPPRPPSPPTYNPVNFGYSPARVRDTRHIAAEEASHELPQTPQMQKVLEDLSKVLSRLSDTDTLIKLLEKLDDSK